jgi:hypothetical protein
VSLLGFDKLHALKATHYLPDLDLPTLAYWDFDRNLGKVWITFSETVYREFFNYSKVLFTSGSALSGGPVYTMRVDNPVNLTLHTSNIDTITFMLNPTQFDELKSQSRLMTMPGVNCYLILEHYVVVDTSAAQNMYQGTDATPDNPRAVRVFVRDTTIPQLVSFTLDMDARQLVLLFTEAVDVSSIRLDQLALQADPSVGVSTEVFRLSNTRATVLTAVDAPQIVLAFTTAAFSQLKAMKYLAKSAESTYLSMSRDFVMDVAGNLTYPGNRVEEVHPSSGRMATLFIPDMSAPVLESWYLDLTLNRCFLTFSKPVDSTTLQPALMTFHSDPRVIPSTVSIALSDTSYVYEESINVVTVQLSEDDAKRVRLLGDQGLCISAETCYLSTQLGFVNGTSAESSSGTIVHAPLPEVAFVQGSNFVADTVPPKLLNYSIDLTAGTLSFVFDEPVVTRLLNASALTLHCVSHSVEYALQLSDFAVPTNTKVSKKFDLQLTRHDLIRLQEATPLATSFATVNLTVDPTFIADVAGNWVVLAPEHQGGGFAPFEFVEDRTPPELVAVDLDVGAGNSNLTLYFSELVHIASIKQSAIQLVSSSGVTVSLSKALRLSSAEPARSVQYSLAPLTTELAAAGLASSQATTHVYIAGPGAVTDVSGAANELVTMSVTAAIRDGPSVASFRLDMNAATLLLELSAVISAVDPTKLTLYSGDLSKSYKLKSMRGYRLDTRGPFLIIDLHASDFTAIRSTFTVQSASDIVLLTGLTAVLDGSGKQLSSAVALPCSVFVPDYAPLAVASYDLDLSLGTLRLYFTKEAETSTADLIDALALHSTALGGADVVLSNLTVIDEPDVFGYVAPNVTSLFLSLNNGAPLTTREQILQAFPLASSLTSTYLSVQKGTIYDLARPRNPLQGIPAVTGGALLQADTLIADTQPPLFETFDLDLNTRTLALHFSEAIDMSTVSVNHFMFLQTPAVASSVHYELTPSSEVVSTAPSRAVLVQLSETDVNAMMAFAPSLLTASANTHVAMRVGAAYDLATPANPSPVTLYRYGVPVRSYAADTTPPSMRWYNMSVQTGDLVLHFDELVVCATVDPHQLMFQASRFNGQSKQFYRLSSASRADCSFGPKYDNFVYVTLDPDDLAALKTFSGFAKTVDNTYLRLLPDFAKDVFGNGNVEVLDGFAQQPTRFIPDTTAPQLLSFLVNNEQQLSLFFDEPVDYRTNVVREYYLQDLYSAPTKSFPLILSKVFRSNPVHTQLDLEISRDLKFIVSGQTDVLVKQSRTFLRVSSDAIRDFSGNMLHPRTRDNAIQLGPAVITWDLDMNTGIVELTFNEAVDSSFSLVGFTVQDSYSNNANNLVFTTARQFTTTAGSTVRVQLNPHDLNALKTSGLASSIVGTRFNITDGPGSTPDLFLTAAYGVTKSTNAGDLVPYMDTVELRTTNAVRVQRLLKDITPPVCQSFSVDLNTGILLLNFDEPTDPDSLQLSKLVLSSSVSGHFVTLSDTNRIVNLVNATQLMVNLSRTDLNSIKREIATSAGLNILGSLVMYSGAVKDLRGNAFAGNNADHPIAADQFVSDHTAPTLLSWSLDRSTLKLRLEFSEYVRYDFVRPDNLVLLSTSNYLTAPLRLQLTNYSKVYQGDAANNEVLVDLELYRQDGFALQAAAAQGLGTSTANTFLAITELRDLFGNAQSGVQVVQATSVVADTKPLSLQAFDWRHASGDTYVTVTLYFSKVVDVDTFACEDLEFREAASHYATAVALGAADCTLQPGQVDSHIVQFTVLHSLFTATTIGDSTDTTYAGAPMMGATQDLSGNQLAAMRSDRYVREGTQLLRYQLNVNQGLVTFDFSKPLDRSVAFNASEFGFYSAISKHTYHLRNPTTAGMVKLNTLPGYSVDDVNNTIGALYLDSFDLTKLKLLDIVPTKLYALVADDATLTDYDGVGLAPLERSRKLAVTAATLDDVAPMITSLDFSRSDHIIAVQVRAPFSLPSRVCTHVLMSHCLLCFHVLAVQRADPSQLGHRPALLLAGHRRPHPASRAVLLSDRHHRQPGRRNAVNTHPTSE